MKWKGTRLRLRCQYLDENGKRCGKMAYWTGPYHGADHYRYGWDNSCTCVQVYLCGKHASYVR